MRAPFLRIWQAWALQWAKLGPQRGERERMGRSGWPYQHI